ncbi:MAG: hypothetical protein IPK32_24780 [Verrucomicrobiaceae bacterium]|nr:hypothetical protein [Verrucomicrobiaceae bacterium]
MFAESQMRVFATILLLGAGLPSGCSKREASYESRFRDEISIDFPSGHPESEVDPMKRQIDERLRASKIGFFSGVMVGERDIDFISVDTDFDLIDEHSLVAELIEEGTIPKDAKATYKRRTDDHESDTPKVR